MASRGHTPPTDLLRAHPQLEPVWPSPVWPGWAPAPPNYCWHLGQGPRVLPQVSLHMVPSQNPSFPTSRVPSVAHLLPTSIACMAILSTPAPCKHLWCPLQFHSISCPRIGTMLSTCGTPVHTSQALWHPKNACPVIDSTLDKLILTGRAVRTRKESPQPTAEAAVTPPPTEGRKGSTPRSGFCSGSLPSTGGRCQSQPRGARDSDSGCGKLQGGNPTC